jgi:dipeptidyl aminopeptidase/acylaminoacyl peptidase
VSQDTLWILDGADGTLRELPEVAGAVPQDPSFSTDGQWLAYLETTTNPSDEATSSTLWMAHADGSDPHMVGGLSNVESLGWSPHHDVFGVLAGPESSQIPCGYPTTLQLASPDGGLQGLVRARGIVGAAWSPDGNQIAVSATGAQVPSTTTLETYPISGGSPTLWASTTESPLNGLTVMDPAAWWTGWGIGFWVFGAASFHNLDRTPLDFVASPGAPALPLGETLSEGITEAFSASPSGSLAIVDASAGTDIGRVYWLDKHVGVCESASRTCAPISAPSTTVTLDPSWSPDGNTLAFTEAPERNGSTFGQSVVADWYSAHQLWLYTPSSRSLRELAGAQGASVPRWSDDGKSLLYAADDGLWLLPTLTATPAEIVKPLFSPGNWPSYYGQVDWAGQFAWNGQ